VKNYWILTMEIMYSIQAVEERMQSQLDGHSSFLVQAMRKFISQGGERVRPAITLFSGEILEADSRKTVDLAAAIEMLHAATQVHAAIVDGRSLNAGEPAFDKHWPPEATVLAGDFVFAKAAKLAADTYSTDVMEMFAKTLATIANGGVTEMFSNGSRFDLDSYYHRIYAKTASLFELAAAAAAKLANAERDVVHAAGLFGSAFGMAFQIMKDVSDIAEGLGDNNSFVDANLRQGVLSLPFLHYLDLNPEDPDLVIIQNKNGHQNGNLERLIKSVRQSEALTLSQSEAHSFVHQALNALAAFPESQRRYDLEALVLSIFSTSQTP
jgi:geranylgeranyl pyrophosphate synthase